MELVWEGKEDASEFLSSIKNDNKEPVSKVQVSKDVALVAGDNIDFLTNDTELYDIVYIDPPYNTHQKFSTYSDDFSVPKSTFKKEHGIPGSVSLSSTQEMERTRGKWLDMMYIVVSLLRDRMEDDGIFFCSLDDNELFDKKIAAQTRYFNAE